MFRTGNYDANSGDGDNRMWAAAELWETTGEAEFLTDSKAAPGSVAVADNFDWDNVGNLGMFTYLLAERTGRDRARSIRWRRPRDANATSPRRRVRTRAVGLL
jgi:endoglucanase